MDEPRCHSSWVGGSCYSAFRCAPKAFEPGAGDGWPCFPFWAMSWPVMAQCVRPLNEPSSSWDNQSINHSLNAFVDQLFSQAVS